MAFVTRRRPLWQARAVTDPLSLALVAELGKKTGVCWLRYAGTEHAAWHVWLDDALHVVSGGEEQHLPGLEDADVVEVVMRSKENGGRLVTWVGRVVPVSPGDERWPDVTAALVAGRLNLADLGTASAEWAERSSVSRIEPTGEVVERPGALSTEDHSRAPRETPATTRGPLPRVLHRRKRRRPGLS